MKLTWKFVTTAAFAVCTCSLMLLGSARPCSAQAGTSFSGPYMLANDDTGSAHLVSSTELSVATPAEPSVPQPSPAMPAPSAMDDYSAAGWHFAISPYLWLPGMNGTVGAAGYEAGIHVSPADLISNINIGIMALADIRYNRIIIPIDFMWAKLSDSKGVAFDPSIDSIKVKFNEDILTPKIGYRVIDNERIKIDGLVGFRYWHLGTTLTLNPDILGYSPYSAQNWADVVAGARFTALLTPKLILTIGGDAGGGGANLDYQVAGIIGYKLKKVILQAGWRYMHVNYRPSSSFVLDVNQTGLVLGVTIPIK